MPAYFEAGKGSIQRPEDHKKFSDNYELIFGKKKDPEREKFIEEVFNAIPVINIPTVIKESDE